LTDAIILIQMQMQIQILVRLIEHAPTYRRHPTVNVMMRVKSSRGGRSTDIC
jgi:hypothetical protein